MLQQLHAQHLGHSHRLAAHPTAGRVCSPITAISSDEGTTRFISAMNFSQRLLIRNVPHPVTAEPNFSRDFRSSTMDFRQNYEQSVRFVDLRGRFIQLQGRR